MKKQELKKGEIVIYKTPQGPEIQIKLDKDSVWLDAHLMAKLFDIDRTVIVKHIKNIYKSKELNEKSSCAKIAQVAADGKIRKMNLYNLDMIISVGYRVNSKQATQFRIWATKTLKEYLIKGYTINEKRLLQAQDQLKELLNTINFLQEKSKSELLSGQEQELLNLLANYAKTLTLLEQYDKEKLTLSQQTKGQYILIYKEVKEIIGKIKRELIDKKEATDLFGQETDEKLKGILGSIYQTFDGKELYASL